MKNKEKYAEDIIALAICGFNIACYKKTKELVACETLDCEKCMFNSDGNCTAFRRSWFESEVELTVEDELKSELETVKKERDELRARLKKAVELPYVKRDCELTQIIYKNSYGDMEEETYFHDCYYGESHDVRGDVYAEARLKELQGGER